MPDNALSPLITAEELAGYLQRDLDRFSAELAIRGASGVVRTFCGWNLSQVVETLTVDANGSVSVNLPTLQLNDVTEVRVDGQVLDPSQYGWGANGVLVARYRWPDGLRRIAADVDHGYDPIPDELRIVASTIAGRLYSNPEGLTQKSSGDNSRSFGAVLSDLEMRLITAYRLT